MPRYDTAVRALNLAELALRQACRGVENDLPDDEIGRAAVGASAQPTLQAQDVENQPVPLVQNTPQVSPVQRSSAEGDRLQSLDQDGDCSLPCVLTARIGRGSWAWKSQTP